jgi:hypothetical protein
MKPILILLFALFLTNCTNQSEILKVKRHSLNKSEPKIVASPSEVNNESTVKTALNEKKYEESIKNAKGLIVLSDQYGKNDFIRFYNEDGSLWYEFTFYYDDSDGKFEYKNENFQPFAFHQDYFSLALKCIGEDKNRYEVIVNEETGLKKFVKKNEPTLKFQHWEDHITKAFAVDFNRDENSLLEIPKGKIKVVQLPNEITFYPVKIEGEWLKVSWNITKHEDNAGSGWIKWKADEKLLIDLFYFA